MDRKSRPQLRQSQLEYEKARRDAQQLHDAAEEMHHAAELLYEQVNQHISNRNRVGDDKERNESSTRTRVEPDEST